MKLHNVIKLKAIKTLTHKKHNAIINKLKYVDFFVRPKT